MQREENDFKKMRLGEVLKQQMKDNDSKRLNDTKERREKILTSGGPEQTSESMQDMKNRLANQRTLTKHELQLQIQMDENSKATKEVIERGQDKVDVNEIMAKHQKEAEE